MDSYLGTNVTDYPELHKYLARRGVKWHHPENCKLIIDDENLHERLGNGLITCQTSQGLKEEFYEYLYETLYFRISLKQN